MGATLANEELDVFLKSRQETGTRDSSGVFTLSTEKAQEKLRQFALYHPRLYVLNLVASAVSGGATRIEFEFQLGRTVMRHNGKPFEEFELQRLWSQLLSPTRTSGYELAIALNAARSLSPTRLFVESWQADIGYRLDIADDVLQVQPLSSPPLQPDLPQCVGVEEASWKRPLLWVFGISERVFLKNKALFAPLELSEDGRLLG